MSAYKIEILPSAEKQILKLPKKINSRVIEIIQALAANPRLQGSKKLTGVNAYRIRVGDYRIVYEIYDKPLIVTIIAAGHRKDIYKW